MDLTSESHYKEYGLFTFMEGRKCSSYNLTYVKKKIIMGGWSLNALRVVNCAYLLLENVMVPVQTTDYIMDVVSQMERQAIKFSLCFRRVLWLQGLRLDNELLVSVIYYQVRLVKQVSTKNLFRSLSAHRFCA